MKVLVLASPLVRAGGIQRYTQTLVRALKDLLGPENTRCLAISEGPGLSGNGRLSARSKLNFVSRALWQGVSWRPDLIICNHLAVGPVGLLLASLGRRPYWVVAHGIEAWGELSGLKSRSLRRANRVVVTSAFSRNQIVQQHRIDVTRTSSLPCTLDETLLGIVPSETGPLARISQGRRMVLTVARMAADERYKGHDEVLRALPTVVASMPDLTYAIVGDGDDRPRLEEMAQNLGLNRHVVFTGEVTDAELAALYRRSEIFILPARTVIDRKNPKGEGFGIVYLEAMAFAKPVIGPNYGAPVEVIQDGKTGLLVDPEDPAQVANALLNLLTRPDQARVMGRVGMERVSQNFSYGSFRERLRGILGIAAEESPGLKS